MRARLASDLGYVLHNAKDASDGATANLPGGTSLALATGVLAQSQTAARVLAPISAMRDALAPRPHGTAPSDPATDGFDPDGAIRWLNENIFTDANNLGGGIYQVPPEIVCTETTVDSSGQTVQTVDQACADDFTAADVRVRVEQDDSTLRFALQLDANHDEPLAFALTHTSLAITLDLDDATRAVIALAPVYGESAPNASASGSITGKLEILGAAHARVSLDFDRAISIKVADQGADLDGPAAYRFASAKAEVASLELDGQAPLVAASLGLGETTLHLPGDPGFSKAIDVDLAGITADASYTGGNALTIDHVSLGGKTTTVAADGIAAMTIDLNPNDGRVLSATITADPATGIETTTVSPRLDLETTIDHVALGDSPPVYDITRVALDGALASSPGSSTVRVVTGSYAIATDPAQYGFSATAGQCVTATDNIDPTTYDSYQTYSVGACN